MNANESCRGCTEAIHPFGGLANTGGALNIRVYLRLTAFSRLKPWPAAKTEKPRGVKAKAPNGAFVILEVPDRNYLPGGCFGGSILRGLTKSSNSGEAPQ